jgi:hypothetical protein
MEIDNNTNIYTNINNTNVDTNMSIKLVLQSYLTIMLLFFFNFMITAMGVVLIYNKIYKIKTLENKTSTCTVNI